MSITMHRYVVVESHDIWCLVYDLTLTEWCDVVVAGYSLSRTGVEGVTGADWISLNELTTWLMDLTPASIYDSMLIL